MLMVGVYLMQPTAAVLVLDVLPHGSNALFEERQVAVRVHHRRRVESIHDGPEVLDVRNVNDLFDVLGPVLRWRVFNVAKRPRIVQRPLDIRI